MKQENKSYKQLITEIKSHPPVLKNPEDLTADIMRHIGEMPQHQRRKISVMYISGWISTVAAALLLCFMVSEMFFHTVPVNEKNVVNVYNIPVESQDVFSINNMPELLSKELSFTEKSEIFLPVFRQMQEGRKRKITIESAFRISRNTDQFSGISIN